MFKFFKRKTKKPILYIRDLIYLEETKFNYKVHFKDVPLMNELKLTIDRALKKMKVYDDQIYVKMYYEYHTKYRFYDRCPLLLFYKIPVMLGTLYNESLVFLSVKDTLNLLPQDEPYTLNIPSEIKLPKEIEEGLINLQSRTYSYLDPELRLDAGTYKSWLRANWLKDCEYYLSNKDGIASYVDRMTENLEKQANAEHQTQVNNLIGRFYEDLYPKF